MAATQSTGGAAAHPTNAANILGIPLDSIDLPAENPRAEFPDAELDSLAESIETVGLLEPIIVRPKGKRFELVAGERRLRAVKLLREKEITASVRELDDREAAEVRLLENLDRKSLNPVEEGIAFRQLEALGHSRESLAKLLRMTEATIDGRLGLLKLPKAWQERVRSSAISAAAAEYILPFVKYPKVLKAMEPAAET